MIEVFLLELRYHCNINTNNLTVSKQVVRAMSSSARLAALVADD